MQREQPGSVSRDDRRDTSCTYYINQKTTHKSYSFGNIQCAGHTPPSKLVSPVPGNLALTHALKGGFHALSPFVVSAPVILSLALHTNLCSMH